MAITAGRKAIAEFVGAFTLIFIGAGAILSPGGSDLLLVAFAHGLAIAVMVSALARISGGHFNPAVTLGALVGRQITPRLAAVHWRSLDRRRNEPRAVVRAGGRVPILRQLVRLLDRTLPRCDRRGPVVQRGVPREDSVKNEHGMEARARVARHQKRTSVNLRTMFKSGWRVHALL